MNKETRKRLKDIYNRINNISSELQDIYYEISDIADEERDKYDNAPESLQETERYMTISDNADMLDDFLSDFESATDSISDLTYSEVFDL